MAFAVRLVEAKRLRGNYDRIARLTFRGQTQSSDVYEFSNEPNWDEEFDWKVDGKLKSSDFIEIEIFNHSRVWKSKMVAKYQMYLKKLLDEPWMSVTEHLVNSNCTILNATITFEVIYCKNWPRDVTFNTFHSTEEKMQALEDWELEFGVSGIYRTSVSNSLKRKADSIASITGSAKAALLGTGLMSGPFEDLGNQKNYAAKSKKKEPKERERYNLHPKVRVGMKAQREKVDFNVQIRLIEGKHFAGTQLDPICDVHCFGKIESSDPKENSNSPYWDELFVFDTVGQRDIVFDEIIEFKVYSGRSLIMRGHLLGTFKIDIGTVYAQPDHRFIRKFACLTDPNETLGASGAGIKGYLKLDITVLAKGDPVKEPPSRKDGEDDLEKNALLPEGMKKMERYRTRFCVRIYKAEGLPKMNSGILANLRKQLTGESKLRDLADPYVEVTFAGMKACTSVKEHNYDPEWVEEIVFCDLEEGIGYRGRIFLSVQMEEGESASDDGISNVLVKGAIPVQDDASGKWESFQLFCCIHEASMIDRKTASKPIQFEMNIANYGNTFDGRVLSSRENDSEDEEEEDIFVKPLTEPAVAESLDREYYNMPYYDTKPCAHIRFPWEDHRKRIYIQNMMTKCADSLEDLLEDVNDRINIEADNTFEYLREALEEFISYCEILTNQLEGKITGTKVGKTDLDFHRINLCKSEVKQIIGEVKDVLHNLKDNKRIRSNYHYVLSIRDRLRKLAREPQTSFPDVFIWLLSGGKRRFYVRVPAADIMYSQVSHESGVNAGRLHTYLLTLPGKSGMKENGWAVKCKLTCLLWLGVVRNKKNMFDNVPPGCEIPRGLSKSTAPPPTEIKYSVFEKFQLRCHLYQARGLIGSDASGLSDAFARVIFGNKAADTNIVMETRNPTWNQTLIFNDIKIWGLMDHVVENPPTIIIEVFDFDEGGTTELIGRAMSRPLVKLAEDPYDKPLFPPKLEWFDVNRGGYRAGEMLAAFELFQITEEEEGQCILPPGLQEMVDSINGGTFFQVPDDIRPTLAPHRIECLFWGVREMKKINFQTVDRPQVELDCIGEIRKSPIIVSAKKNPNFPEPWAYMDLDLPEEDRYCPPLTISVRDTRMFGKEILVGTAIVNSLSKYVQHSDVYLEDNMEKLGKEKAEIKEVTNMDTNEQEPNDTEIHPNDIGIDNVAREGDGLTMADGESCKPSGKPSLGSSRRGSKVPSLAPSRAVSFAPGSKTPSQRVTPAKLSSKGSKVWTPWKDTSNKSNSIHTSMASRSRCKNPNMRATPLHNSRRDSVASMGQSSQIRYRIVSNPGLVSDTPLKKIFTPKNSLGKSSQQSSVRKKNKQTAKMGNPEVASVTPFKTLIEKPPSPARSIKANKPLLTEENLEWNDSFEVKELPRRRSLVEQITTPIKQLTSPIKSMGSKIVSPIHSFRGSQPSTLNRVSYRSPSGAPSSIGSNPASRRLSQTESAQELMTKPSCQPPALLRTPGTSYEMEIGAEAGNFAEYRPPVRVGGDGAEQCELDYMNTKLSEDEVVEEETDEEQVDDKIDEQLERQARDREGLQPALPAVHTEQRKEEDGKENTKEELEPPIYDSDLEIKEGETMEASKEDRKKGVKKEGEAEEPHVAEDEEQIDWWSRYYETVRDKDRAKEEREAQIEKQKKLSEKKGKTTVHPEPEEEEEIEEEVHSKKKKKINPKITRLKIYERELEEVIEFDGFRDVVESFPLLRGKSKGNDDDDESRIYGKFKGALKVWKYPLPRLFDDENNMMGSFKMLPTMNPVNLLCRVYVVKAIGLHPTDIDGKADPYVKLTVGKHVVKDRHNYVPKQLSPTFGRVFDFEVIIPFGNMLTIGVYDHDVLGSDDLIGETKIDIENRFFSKHRATCGISRKYSVHGFNKWRDPIKPTAILQRLCKNYKLDGPHFSDGKCCIEGKLFHARDHIIDDNGQKLTSDEPSALLALRHFDHMKGVGYPLVPEHVETRSLWSSRIPGIAQGELLLWVDLFDMNGPSPGAAVDITPRKPTAYELRCIIWNTEDVQLGDINILTGLPSADIYVKGWIDGINDHKHHTDIHYTSLNGEGNFNWRFIFPFNFHKAEEKIVVERKASLFSWDTVEEKLPPRLSLECWDSDLLGGDDLIGTCTFKLTSIPRPAKASVQCTLETMGNKHTDSIFKKKHVKGWWPFGCSREDSEPELVGKVEVELELLSQQEAEQDPAGLGRKEPNPLPFPDRPDLQMQWMMNPLKALRYFLWEQYKFCFAKFVLIGIIFFVIGLFFYSMPGTIVQRLFGA